MTVTTIEVDDTTRIRVEHDTDADDPRGWGDHIDVDNDVVNRWREGEVYGVILEKRVLWTRSGPGFDDSIPNTMTTWEEVGSIWGCYLDDTYTARVVANEHFGVPL